MLLAFINASLKPLDDQGTFVSFLCYHRTEPYCSIFLKPWFSSAVNEAFGLSSSSSTLKQQAMLGMLVGAQWTSQISSNFSGLACWYLVSKDHRKSFIKCLTIVACSDAYKMESFCGPFLNLYYTKVAQVEVTCKWCYEYFNKHMFVSTTKEWESYRMWSCNFAWCRLVRL